MLEQPKPGSLPPLVSSPFLSLFLSSSGNHENRKFHFQMAHSFALCLSLSLCMCVGGFMPASPLFPLSLLFFFLITVAFTDVIVLKVSNLIKCRAESTVPQQFSARRTARLRISTLHWLKAETPRGMEYNSFTSWECVACVYSLFRDSSCAVSGTAEGSLQGR